MNYIGEHLFIGQLGHFMAVLSLMASLVATFAYFTAGKQNINFNEKRSWVKLARIAFFIETIAVLTIFFLIYFIISHHYHEYYYAWNHSSRSLEPKYLFASFWEGQEGSFMLWNVWHCVLGWLLIWRHRRFESQVMTVVSFAQFCIATMLLGIYVFGVKIGSNPFILFREQMPNIPIFQRPDYLSLDKIHEGNDLNALLQNYWMVIHPPILFLGFASSIVPFAFAYAGLVTKNHKWTKEVLPWSLFSSAVLGTGIMMGAAWAYESLSFGGYWAWDPVENASLVPWLVLVAGLHCNLIYKSTGYSLKTTYLFYILGFTLVLYSTFLTRSGILGDTSVHAFTGADMTTQLVMFVLVFFVPAMILFFARGKYIPVIKKEESSYSREFWMFIGSLVLFLSAIVITAKTSIPVYNKIFGTNIAPPEDVVFSYNQVQIFIAIIISVLTAITQYLKYKDTTKKYFLGKIAWPTAIALAISFCISFLGNISYTQKGAGYLGAIHIAIFAAVYGVVANASYIFITLKGKLKNAGASVAHVGFALALVGILISGSKKTTLSQNTTGIAIFEKTKDEDPRENITLFQGVKTDMGKYDVTYVKDSFETEHAKRQFFELNFVSKDGKENFILHPDVMTKNKGQESPSANPDKKHYWNRDIFVYVSSWKGGSTDDTSKYRPIELQPNDTVFYSTGMIVMNGKKVNPQDYKVPFEPGETGVVMDLTVMAKDGRRYSAQPAIILKDSTLQSIPDTIKSQGLIIAFNKIIDPQKDRVEFGVKEDQSIIPLLTLKVYEFPFINILWIGVVIMVIGFVMSIIQRVKKLLPASISPVL